jgi:hypothetical protein
MIKEYWKRLYTSNEKIKDNQFKEGTQKWFEGDQWEEYKENIKKAELEKILDKVEMEEIEKIIKKLKNNKTEGTYEIINEQIKYGPKILWETILKIINNVMRRGKIPERWKEM